MLSSFHISLKLFSNFLFYHRLYNAFIRLFLPICRLVIIVGIPFFDSYILLNSSCSYLRI
nr:MAG TPA: hypothetical protein [Caudoviricetes sp.]